MTAPSRSFKRRPSRARIILRWAQSVFLGIGILALGYYGFVRVESQVFQAYQSWRLDQIQQGKPASKTRFVTAWLRIPLAEDPASASQRTPLGSVPKTADATPTESSTLSPSSEAAPKTFPEPEPPTPDTPSRALAKPPRRVHVKSPAGALIGKIEIPRIHLSAIVMEGIDTRTLRWAVGHIPGTPLPGDAGNVGLAGHRDSFFLGLRNIEKGDLITMSTASGGFFRYRVSSMVVISPDQAEILNKFNGSGINLITCYPFNFIGAAPQRFVVHADELGAASTPANLSSSELGPASLDEVPPETSRPAGTHAYHRRSARQPQPVSVESSARLNSRAKNKTSFSGISDSTFKKSAERSRQHLPRSRPNRLRAFIRRVFKGDGGAAGGALIGAPAGEGRGALIGGAMGAGGGAIYKQATE